MPVASFALVNDYKNKDNKPGILFTNEHHGKYGSLLPGGRLTDDELKLYSENQIRAVCHAVVREVNEELNLFFVPNLSLTRVYPLEFGGKTNEAWFLGGHLYTARRIDPHVIVSRLDFNEVVKFADESVKPLSVLDLEEIRSNVQFPGMCAAASGYLRYRELPSIVE